MAKTSSAARLLAFHNSVRAGVDVGLGTYRGVEHHFRAEGTDFVRRVESMGIKEVVTVPGSPWQNPYCERLIGSIRRECFDHVIVLNERHLLRVLRSYASYYTRRERTGHWTTTALIRVLSSRRRWAMW